MSTEPRNAQQARLAKNQALFRVVNERMQMLAGSFGTLEAEHTFVCECSDPDCAAQLDLRTEEYEEIRADPARFLIAPGHEISLVEVVVVEKPTYFVVEKIEAGRQVAVATDPRQVAQ